MTAARRCPHCGAGLLEDVAASAACPVCLFKLALEPASESGVSSPDAWTGAESSHEVGLHPLRIGPYRILTVLGQGGMGVVYLAEQEHPIRRKVALKVVKVGMDTREVVARFDTERQALALMSHPNIARVLDAGASDEGRPYFVMEYVPGIPITDYCDRNRLSTRERLALFITVCQAVQHAHQKGIIHRDLKPSNVLVAIEDGRPVPKVIDFGIAKATHQRLTEQTVFTRHGVLIGTPEYMSPEQADPGRLEVDTTTDIYSLGVILYELLVGVLPFDGDTLRKAAYAELVRIIQDEEPARPSLRVTGLGADASDMAKRRNTDVPSLRKQLRGDLDWIVLRALEKDRTRRYASASEFAADIERHLADEPVMASPPSAVYRLKKTYRRHRVVVAAALVVVLALSSGLVVSTGLYVRAEEARRETDRQRMAANRRGYVANIAAAKAAIESNQIREARQRLRACPASFRDWEWHHLWSRTDSSLATIGTGGGAPTSVSVTPDGTKVLWVTENGVAHAADLASRMPIPEFRYPQPGASEPQSTIAMSADGTAALVVGRALPSLGATISGKELPLRVPDRPSPGEAVLTLTVAASPLQLQEWAEESLSSPDTSPSDTPAADGAARTLTVFDMRRGKPSAAIVLPGLGVSPPIVVRMPADRDIGEHGLVTVLYEEGVVSDSFGRKHATMSGRMGSTVSAAFSRDGRRIATWTWDHVIRVWNAETGKAEAVLAGHRDGITQAVFSPDGSRVASASHDGTVRVWPIASSAAAMVLTGHQGAVLAVAFDTQGRRIVSGGEDNFARVWDLGGKEMARLAGHQDGVTAVAFSPDGTCIATGSLDATVRLWDVTSGRLEDTLRGHDGGISSIAFGPDGRTVVSGSTDQTVRFWDGFNVSGARAPFEGVFGLVITTWSSSPVRLFGGFADGSIQAWNPGDPRRAAQWPGPVRDVGPDGRGVEVDRIAASADGTRIVTSSYDGAVVLWQPANRTVPTILQAPGPEVATVTIAADGSLAAAAFKSGKLMVWDANSGRVVASWTRPSGAGIGLSFGPDSKTLADGAAAVVTTWDALRGTELRKYPGSESPVYITKVSPDGRLLACGYRDGTVRLWDVATGAPRGVLRGDSGYIWSIAFHPSGSRLATQSVDGVVRVWDIAAGESLLVYGGKLRTVARSKAPWGVSFDREGRRLLAAGQEAVVSSFDTWTAYPVAAVEAVESASKDDPLPEAVIRRLLAAPNLDAPTREAAVRIVEARGVDPDALYGRCWNIVRSANADVDSYARAVRYAETAVAMAPHSRELLDVLAVALYRAGRFQDSLAAAQERSAAIRGKPDSLHVIVGAMCYQRLGDTERAKAALASSRKQSQNWWLHPTEDAATWLQEAEALILGAGGKPSAPEPARK